MKTDEELEKELDIAGYFLRDDLEIRTGVEQFKGHEQAYSLFNSATHEREAVYAGKKRWAIEQAHAFVVLEVMRRLNAAVDQVYELVCDTNYDVPESTHIEQLRRASILADRLLN